MTKKSTELNIFFAYSRADIALRDRLDIHLAGMKRQKFINTWFDGKIEPGKEWEKEIFETLSQSDIILLLISPDFIASDYCYDIEMKRAIVRHEKGEAKVIPIILSHCDWKETPFSKLQALPKDAIPVLDSKWYSEDEALHSISIGIKGIVNRIVEERDKKISDYYTEIDSLKTEHSQLVTKIEFLKKEEKKLEESPKSKLLADLEEKEQFIQQQKISIYELKNKLNEYTKTPIDTKIINPTQRAKVVNSGAQYSSINQASQYSDIWINDEIRKKAGENDWVKTGFKLKEGMIGEIVDSFVHKTKPNYTVYILKIDGKNYVPIGEKGIEILTE